MNPSHPRGTPEYVEAGAAFQLAVPVDPAVAVTAACRAGWPLRVHTAGHALSRVTRSARPRH